MLQSHSTTPLHHHASPFYPSPSPSIASDYEILKAIGEGSYGIVTKARHIPTGRIVAIKYFKSSTSTSQRREINLLKTLYHPNIVCLHDTFMKGGKIQLVFDYVSKNLLQVLETSSQGLSPYHLKKCIYQMLKALHHCHARNIIHRDVKPENLLVDTNDMSVKLCDFGFSRYGPDNNNQGGDKNNTMMEQHSGSSSDVMTAYVATRWYRSPELLVGDGCYDSGVDLWAVGCLMAELCDKIPLFPGENECDQLLLIQKTLGALTPQQTDVMKLNNALVKITSLMTKGAVKQTTTLDRRYATKMSKDAIDLMKSLLTIDPAQRCSASQALAHPYFDEMRQEEDDMLMEAGDTTPVVAFEQTEKSNLVDWDAKYRSKDQNAHHPRHLNRFEGKSPPSIGIGGEAWSKGTYLQPLSHKTKKNGTTASTTSSSSSSFCRRAIPYLPSLLPAHHHQHRREERGGGSTTTASSASSSSSPTFLPALMAASRYGPTPSSSVKATIHLPTPPQHHSLFNFTTASPPTLSKPPEVTSPRRHN